VTERTRERVLAAVRELLAAGTFHGSRMEDVAARAGVSRASVYQHFGSRLGLVDAICELFDRNPELVALRASTDVDGFVAGVVRFWASEEEVLRALYGAAAVDPAAGAFVERQRHDRRGEVERLLRACGVDDGHALARLLVLTSFETFEELRRHAGLAPDEVTQVLQADAQDALAR
jgi:AcrR family transcriptional regulator